MSMGAIVAELSRKWSSRSHRRMVRSHGCPRGVPFVNAFQAGTEAGHEHVRGELGAAGPHIVGMVVRHGEAFSITEKLTVWESGKAIYRPTVRYAYCPCGCAIASLRELRGCDYRLQPRIRR
jgi:homospermidine synthase